MRVAIGIPSSELVHADFAMALSSLIGFTLQKTDVELLPVINVKSSIIEKGRHEIVEKALELNADKLLFLDSDMIFPPDLLKKFLVLSKDIVGCNYLTRRRPFKPTCRDLRGELLLKKEGLQAVGFLGTGCLLVDMKVFKSLKKPYFKVKWDKDKNTFSGEDYNFCEEARKKGYDVYCDHELSLDVKHIGSLLCSL